MRLIPKLTGALCLNLVLCVSAKSSAADLLVDNETELVTAAENARPGTTIRIAAGPSTACLPKGEQRSEEADPDAYLIRLRNKADNITLSDLTLLGPQMHGAVFGTRNQHVHFHHLRIENLLYSGIRCYFMSNARIHDCEFIGAGGK
jgi:hypothetical protein